MSSLTDSERVLLRARSLMINRGYGWSKAIARAAELTEDDNAAEHTDGRGMEPARPEHQALVGESLPARA